MARQGRVRTFAGGVTRRTMMLGLAALPVTGCYAVPKSDDKPKLPRIKKQSASDRGALIELKKLNPDIRLDIRYATPSNFTGQVLYDQARAFLVGPAANALARAQLAAANEGYGLLIFDAYRPWRVTKRLWDMTPPDKRGFVANPKEGSRHNRGCAVDLTLYDRATGNAVSMPSAYDEFTSRAYRNYTGGSANETANRARLEQYMEAQGFAGISNEWWHFDYKDWAEYPILDVPFSRI